MLKIKKQIKNSDGTITELEGTEAEVEAFLKKQNKKDETVQKKKNLILGKEMEAAVQELIDAAIMRHVEHHWYHNNGWWWRPLWVGNTYTYQATNVDPITSPNFITCSNTSELSTKTGLSTSEIINSSNTGGHIVGSASNNLLLDNSGYSTTAAAKYTSNSTPVTSGFINMNVKS